MSTTETQETESVRRISFVYVQLCGMDYAKQIPADKAEYDVFGSRNLILYLDGVKIGEFDHKRVDGWWYSSNACQR
jgi:hypothetical protein